MSDRFPRTIEARMRLRDAACRHEFPDDPRELAKLAYLLNYADPNQLEAELKSTWQETRARFNRLFT
jgi:glutamine synthetase adenylyltransferase